MKKSNPATVLDPAKCIYNIIVIYEWDEAKNSEGGRYVHERARDTHSDR